MQTFHYQSVVSTMDTARTILNNSPPITQSFYVTADEQTSGRGRYNRQWITGRGNLHMTLAVRVQDSSHLPFYSYIASVSVLETVKQILGPAASKATLKWPNDLLIEGKKCCGILLEACHHAGSGSSQINESPWLLIGIGLNIKTCPTLTAYPTTKLDEFCKAPMAIDIANTLSQQFSSWEARFVTEGFSPLRKHWVANRDPGHSHINIVLAHQNQPIEGTFHDINRKGQLEISVLSEDTNALEIKIVNAGDIFFL